MSTKSIMKAFAASGPIGLTLVFIGLWPLAHFLPPLRPSWGAETIAEIYRAGSLRIRLGGIAILVGSGLLSAFYTALSVYLRRIEGRDTPLAYVQLVGGTVTVAGFAFVAFFWMAPAFRPEHAADMMLFSSDMGWIVLISLVPPAVIQNAAIGAAILCDRHSQPLFPRWVGYLNIWVGILLLPGLFATLFRTGPFAWDGILSFWVGAVATGIWVNVMWVMMGKAEQRVDRAGEHG